MEEKMHDRRITPSVPWRTPVYVRIGHGASEAINDAHEALHYLNVRWPTERGKKYTLACVTCANAVERRESAEVAREAFIAAAIEALILA
ncbi:conserved hypothetical protein [Agrobacterium tumefaciens str. Kerr 14]|uniref:DUF982 domain-containing protein n=1 Tax=Agrobacterium tumefaciens str. Kerr 14 TaxID=1183424 RepID=A0A1S7SCY8_AGRTU|nr:conserved hypothetical protein [Agrobacterium tumefaciens str. Kerr 14]